MIPQLVFFGSPSQDRLHRGGQIIESIGGAAFISALAARVVGARVGLVARVPPRLPESVASAFGPGGLMRAGLRSAVGRLPTFHIHYDAEERATYSHVDNGLEAALEAELLPEEWLAVPHLHLAAVGETAEPQLALLKGLRGRGYRGRISAGTYLRMLQLDLDSARRLMREVHTFFCNAEEFALLCPEGPPPGLRMCVTAGAAGCWVLEGGRSELHPAPALAPGELQDATGAGDAFCGGFLAGEALGMESVAAGQGAARRVLSGPGALPLIAALQPGPRARAVPAQISAVAAQLSALAKSAAFDFAQPPHLPAGHAAALAMLCASTLQQFGFWTADPALGWRGPMVAPIEGQLRKGSDFIWAAYARAARQDPSALSPERLAAEPDLLMQICQDDQGGCPLPEPAEAIQLQRAFGRAMLEQWPGGYAALLEDCNRHVRPVARLIAHLSRLPGYMEDPLLKKAHLLAIILSNRPERFLRPADQASIPPVVDYHLMRACLRTGCVELLDPELERRLRARAWVDAPEEQAIRQASYAAISALVAESGQDVAAVDGFFFALGRRLCLEVEAPRCGECPLSACARRVELFQPVFRTTDY